MTIGGKYIFKADSNPGVGQYSPNISLTKPKIKSAIINEEVSPYRRPVDQSPSIGQYDGHLKPFGYNENNMTFGGKYIFKADSNPPVGLYNIEKAI